MKNISLTIIAGFILALTFTSTTNAAGFLGLGGKNPAKATPPAFTPIPTNSPAVAAPVKVAPTADGPQYVSLGAGSNSTANATTTMAFDTNNWSGMIGGLPCLFGNQTREDITYSLECKAGTFTIDLPAGTNNVNSLTYNIMPGNYNLTFWSTKNTAKKQNETLVVHDDPCHTIYKVGSFHAVFVVRP